MNGVRSLAEFESDPTIPADVVDEVRQHAEQLLEEVLREQRARRWLDARRRERGL
ncbi:MAG TPA: hypothetical protein VGG07_14245 [Solirubrobacteraceae bacterium]|jgi:hypothetical protein